jgi:hypothetical protein
MVFNSNKQVSEDAMHRSGLKTAALLSATLIGLLSGCSAQAPQALQAQAGATSTVRLAPGDVGDPAVHHDFVVTTNGIDNVFTWIPRFEAYQLIRPSQAGHKDRPVGTWVGAQPQGIAGVDWARQDFGGFYVAKYEASRTGETQPAAAVTRGAQPWATTWLEANAVSKAMVPGASHLMRGDEWTALAVWSELHGVDVRGNTLAGIDADQPSIVWEQKLAGEAALTGTAKDATWANGVNLTSHTGRAEGVLDLVGNVQEWDGALSMVGYELTIDNQPLDVGATVPGYVASLHTDPLLRQFGVAGRTQQTAVSFFRSDYFHGGGLTQGHDNSGTHATTPADGPVLTYRGGRGGSFDRGHHDEPAQAGMWLLCVNRTEDFKSNWMGFRPALRY